MYRKFVTARSPLRLLEKGLQGGLGKGNLGLVLAGHGVGKTAFLVGLALDDLMRGGHVLHVSLQDTVAHVRAHYDTVFDDLASSTHLDEGAVVHADVDRHRHIRSYAPGAFSAAKLREAVKFESEAGAQPELVIVDGMDLEAVSGDELKDLRSLARELGAEIWLSAACEGDRVDEVPAALKPAAQVASVILVLEPAGGHVALRALKDHDNPDLSALHVALDPRTLLIVRG
jgi:archaellum biogenesis ATPase FlaH